MTNRMKLRARKAFWDRVAYHGIGIGTAFFFLAPFLVSFLSSFRSNKENAVSYTHLTLPTTPYV